jgi:hypothetical protein
MFGIGCVQSEQFLVKACYGVKHSRHRFDKKKMFWSKERAPSNIKLMPVALDTSHEPMFLLNDSFAKIKKCECCI